MTTHTTNFHVDESDEVRADGEVVPAHKSLHAYACIRFGEVTLFVQDAVTLKELGLLALQLGETLEHAQRTEAEVAL